MCFLIKNQCHIHIQHFIGLNDPPNIFISSENIVVNDCVSHCLQQLLKQIARE